MLKEMRQNTKTILWIVIVAFIGLIVVGWGMQRRAGARGPEAGYVGTVGGDRITTQEYRSELENQRAAYVEQYGRPKGAEAEQQIVDASWDAIVRRHVLWKEIRNWHIGVTNDEVLREIQYNPPPFIRTHPAFMTDSTFDHQKYLEALRDPRIDFSFLENYVRESLPFAKLEDYLAGCIRVTDEELLSLVALFQETAAISYIRVSPLTDAGEEVEPSETVLRAYFDENKEKFRIPEKRVLDFVRIPKEPSIEDKRYARERIEEAFDLIAAGDSFDEIAVLYSDDQSTASKGGEMGWIAEGRLPPEADSVVFNLDVGQVSDIVEIHRAYHIFMVTDKREQSGRREVNLSQIMAIADTSPATIEMLADNAKDLTSAARDRGLDEAASEFEYTVEQADGVTLEVAARTLGVDQADMEKVFSTRPGKVMNPVEGRTAFYVIEVESASPAHIPAFEDALDDVRRAYVHDVETEKAREIAGEIASDVEKGSSLEAAAAARGLKVRSTEPFTRMTNVPGIGSVNEVTAHAFALETGQTAGPIENQGSFFIIRVDSRQSFDENQIAQQFDDLKLSAVMSKRQGFVGDWYNKARSKVKIEDYREAAY